MYRERDTYLYRYICIYLFIYLFIYPRRPPAAVIGRGTASLPAATAAEANLRAADSLQYIYIYIYTHV